MKNKKWLIIGVIIVIAVVIVGVITNYIDSSRVTTNHEPKFCIKTISSDGCKVTYWGLGYKVIKFNRMGGYNKVKIGSWSMQYEDFDNEIEEFENAPIYMYSAKEPEDRKQLSDSNARDFRYFLGNLVYDKEVSDESMITYIFEDLNGATYYYRSKTRILSKNDKSTLLDDTSFEFLNEIISDTMSINNN